MMMAGLTSTIEREPAEFATRALFDAGYDMLIAQHRNQENIYERLLGRLREGIADGALIIPATGSAESIEDLLIDFSFPIVFIDRHPKQLTGKVDIVTTDNEKAAYELTKKVIECGAVKIHVYFNADNEPSHERKKGALRAMSEMKIENVTIDKINLSDNESWGIVANAQDELLKFANIHSKFPFYFGGAFDNWIGNIHPFKQIFICKQNFKKMAEDAVQLLIMRMIGENKLEKQILKVEHLNLSEII
jgi:DNA-binding LacI/PurR family transcriptional regulator